MKKILLLLTFFYSVSALGAPLPTADEIWKLYDAKEYNKVLSKIYLLKNIPSKQNDPDLYFLEALLAYQTGFFARVISMRDEYKKTFMLPTLQGDPKLIFFYWVRLSSLVLETYRSFLFGDHLGAPPLKIGDRPQMIKRDPQSTIRWSFSYNDKGNTELWADEVDAISLKKLTRLKKTLKENPALFLNTLSLIVQEAIYPYDNDILKKDFFASRLKLQWLDLKWDLSPPSLKNQYRYFLNQYETLFNTTSSTQIKTVLLLRLGKINAYLKNNSEAVKQLTSFIKVQGPSVWTGIAHRYLADVYLHQSRYKKAITSLKKAMPGDQSLNQAYLTYRLAYALRHAGQHKKAIKMLGRLLNTKWQENKLLLGWQKDLIRHMAFYLADHHTHPRVLRALTGKSFYVNAVFEISDFNKGKRNFKKAYDILRNLKGVKLSKENKITAEQKAIWLSLELKQSAKALTHCKNLAEVYSKIDGETHLEEILYQTALNLDKQYLQKKKKTDFMIVKELSEYYFSLFGQKGSYSAKMVKLSSPYLKLWGMN